MAETNQIAVLQDILSALKMGVQDFFQYVWLAHDYQ